MDLKEYTYASSYIEPNPICFSPKYSDFFSLKGRFITLLGLGKKILILPFALFFKVYKSFFKIIKVLATLTYVFLTLGLSKDTRRNFAEKLSFLGKDLADWIIFPLALFIFLLRHLLGATLHPKFSMGL